MGAACAAVLAAATGRQAPSVTATVRRIVFQLVWYQPAPWNGQTWVTYR
jgi:hypothetical protein